ncbi:MAG: PLP-dependent transferase [Lachnospiraceae bacterium]|nr:PLP-dependent transferase [Lachnospiraceae bacterium]
MHEAFQIRDRIWQVQEARGVYFTVIQGDRRAIVMDTGHGIADNRGYVDQLLSVPYIVINSHGHPDHTQGNYQFEEVYIHPLDLPAYENSNTEARRAESYDRLRKENGLLEEGKEAFVKRTPAVILPLKGDEVYDLGGLTVRVTELPGHTKGTIGLLVEEERLLIAGDAFNPDMWMFVYNHDTLAILEKTLTRALGLPFDTYLGGHTIHEIRKEFLEEVRNNVRTGRVDWDSYEVILGQETYQIRYSGEHGTSQIAIPLETALELKEREESGFNTMLLHGVKERKVSDPHGSILPPIYQTSAYAHESAESIADVFAKKKTGFNYTRISNPTIAAFEERMTELERGIGSIACASGMAAITYALLNVLKAGDEFIASAGLYGGTINLFHGFAQFGIRVRYVEPNHWRELENAVNERTRLIFTETIGNPGLIVTDIRKTAEIAHAHRLPLVVDNTMASAYLVRPLELGADVVINSTSKYINGTGNSISGVVTDGGTFDWDAERFPQLEPFLAQGRNCYLAKLRGDMLCNHGGCLSPQNAFQNIVGMETMGLRMERECSNALALAEHLSKVPGIIVNYPGLEINESYETARKQLRNGYGTILTLRVGSRERAFALMDALKLPFVVSNIGDIRTLVVHPASTMALHSTEKEKEDAGVFEDLIRVSVGIEDIGDIIADFDRALHSMK